MNETNFSLLQHIFDNLNIRIRQGSKGRKENITWYYINNPDGTIRWIWPRNLSHPLFLKFYNITNFKSQFIAFTVRLFFFLKIQKIIAKKVQVEVLDESLNENLGNDWALFAGTSGVNRTALLYSNEMFTKIPVGQNGKAIVLNEYNRIQYLNHLKFEKIEISQVNKVGSNLIQNDVSKSGKRTASLTFKHWHALQELSLINRCEIRISDLSEIINFEKDIQFLSQDERISNVLLGKLIKLKQSLNPEQFIVTSFGHRDFTPWNIFEKEHHIALIDWELSKHFTPLFYDGFHFIYQQKSLVDNQNFEAILDTITLSFNNLIVNNEKVDYKVYHQLYILITSIYYLKIYSLEKQWSPQIHKSMNVWNEALSFLLVESKIASQREVLLQDIFSFLKSENYAALKWTIDKPEHLSEESDIDLCIDRVSSKKLDNYLSKHPFINSIKYNKKSFMKNAAILLKDNTFLSIDSLWKFKRKSKIMLSESDFLKSAKANSYGVKVASMEQDIMYTWFFYILNNASVPFKYLRHYTKLLKQQNNESQINLKPILRNFKYNKNVRIALEKKLNLMPENMNLSKVKNIILYVKDTLKENFFNKGFIITFSGVDGAGKSTVIENMKHQIEKKFRRKVVVLRHRPAILPMLSAWKEGAKVAEQKAAERLPRQGNNSNFLSSLCRFSYYYLDYFFGQFVIYTKYVMRGYIVLYDRYYFDFINDSKRSNIELPRWLTKGFYFFLLKPKFNFFLYADADIILKRKQELDRNTINNLTQNYLKLFKQLNIKNLTSQYVSIKNEQLPTTIKTINNYIQLEML